jgi:hypothetical protein
MTCREFEQRTALLTLRDISQARDQQTLSHAGECPKCADWLQEQRMLAASMQTLQAQTADREAGPNVEQALLRTFRQGPAETLPPEMARRISPIAFSLSRFFEVGAYVAVAAAIAVAIFLGVRLWEQHSVNLPVQSQGAQPSVSVPSVSVPNPVAKGAASNAHEQLAAVPRTTNHRSRGSQVVAASQTTAEATDSSQVSTDADYVALMFCDPLSCASDAQVVRMELPSPGAAGSGTQQDAQVRVADVVVGYDGVVRAVRIVN